MFNNFSLKFSLSLKNFVKIFLRMKLSEAKIKVEKSSTIAKYIDPLLVARFTKPDLLSKTAHDAVPSKSLKDFAIALGKIFDL